MCGLSGFIEPGGASAERLREAARGMAAAIAHRGPDDADQWSDPAAGLAFGFCRLSIIDLSPAGRQPMESASERYVVQFNGEVYNHAAIREELALAGRAPGYRGHSDTETILAAVEAWGVAGAVKKFIGMFAIALWDRRERRLHLVRDRVGVKPLYCGRIGKTFLFGSELKALRAHPAFRAEIDREALALFMRYNYVPAPLTIYKGIRKVRPGTILTVTAAGEESVETYWSASEVVQRGLREPFRGGDAEAVDQLDAILRDAVGLRMIADVPLGVFLSGGVDSSTVVALMQAQSSRPVRSFSIGFRETDFDEAPQARAVARHIGTEHTELYVTPRETLDVVPRLAAMYDEPFADPSQIPTYLVSALARRQVTVALSGDGGDELLGGYNRYVESRRLWGLAGWAPAGLRAAAAALAEKVGPRGWEAVFRAARPLLPGALRQRPADKFLKLAEIMGARTPDAFYEGLVSHWRRPGELVLGGEGAAPPAAFALDDFTDRAMARDLVTYLPDDILVKVDRASMAVSLEAREPLLDHRLVEFAWRLPRHMKIRGGRGKWVLRQVLRRYVPEALWDRPKMGFGVPIGDWLRGPLRDWSEQLLGEARLRGEGFLNAALVRRSWTEHLSGARNWQYRLWNVLIFQQWLENERREARTGPL